jgi:hypothetical protein
MTGVKLAKAFGVLLMVVIVCSKQIPEEQHSTYPATDEAAHFTSHEHHDVLNAGERLIRAAARPLEYPAGTTNNNKQVTFHMNYDAQIADRNQLRRDEKTDLDRFMGSISAKLVLSHNFGVLIACVAGI